MPVLGHALVGLAIGVVTRPPAHRRHAVAPRDGDLWLPVVVLLAYLPDVIAQLGLVAGWTESRLLGHSVPFALAVSPAIAVVLTRVVSVSFARALITVLASLLLHDFLDLAQATDRAPWWPLSDRHVALALPILPSGLIHEAVVFGALFLGALTLRGIQRRRRGRPAEVLREHGRAAHAWVGHAFVLALVLAAVATHWLRDARERELETGRALIEAGAYGTGLQALARAEHWPSTARPGRIDYLRGEAYAGLGDRAQAEASYLRSLRADPTYFWAVADLALFYASSTETVAERRRLAGPYVAKLQADFPGHPELPRVLARVDRKLASSSSAPQAPRQPDQR